MSILVCCTARDPCVELVARAVEERRGRICRLDSARFPTDLRLSLEPGTTVLGAVDVEGSSLALGEISAVWIRTLDTGAGLPHELEPEMREACRLQSGSALWAFLQCLPAFQLDPPEVLERAPYKPRQIQLARSAGLDVPRTLLSNDPEMVRSFAADCPGGIITKLVDSASVMVQTAAGLEPIYTRSVSPEELDALAGLELCPMIFQERVPKALELRITVVGSRMFVAAIGPGASAPGSDDWRQDRTAPGVFRPYGDLPEAVRRRLFSLLDGMGLNFATVDMIRTPDGRHVFLEANTVSSFAFIERSAGLPISAAIADLLLGRTAPRIRPLLPGSA